MFAKCHELALMCCSAAAEPQLKPQSPAEDFELQPDRPTGVDVQVNVVRAQSDFSSMAILPLMFNDLLQIKAPILSCSS